MNILSDLWYGNISPCERRIPSDSEYLKLFTQFCNAVDKLEGELPQEKQQLCEDLGELQLKLMSIGEKDTFILGFRLGARMMLDIIRDDV